MRTEVAAHRPLVREPEVEGQTCGERGLKRSAKVVARNEDALGVARPIRREDEAAEAAQLGTAHVGRTNLIMP
jgi:hypothetical protein